MNRFVTPLMKEFFYVQFGIKVVDVVKQAENALTLSEYLDFLVSCEHYLEEKIKETKEIKEKNDRQNRIEMEEIKRKYNEKMSELP